MSPLLKSAVFPGWGQFSNNQKSKGIMIGVLFWSGLVVGISANAEALNHLSFESAYTTARTLSAAGFGLALITYIFNLVDARSINELPISFNFNYRRSPNVSEYSRLNAFEHNAVLTWTFKFE